MPTRVDMKWVPLLVISGGTGKNMLSSAAGPVVAFGVTVAFVKQTG